MSAAAALVWAKGVVGEVSARPVASRPFAQGQVFELQGAAGRYALKCHHSAAGFHQERDAYERWASALTHSAPALRAASEPHQALLLPWVDGVDGDAARQPLLSSAPGSPLDS